MLGQEQPLELLTRSSDPVPRPGSASLRDATGQEGMNHGLVLLHSKSGPEHHLWVGAELLRSSVVYPSAPGCGKNQEGTSSPHGEGDPGVQGGRDGGTQR